MIQRRLIKKMDLNNGLSLELLDKSRRLAGDRWLVSLEARIEVPVEKGLLSEVQDTDNIVSLLKKEYGRSVEYSYTQERHFVDEREKEKVFQDFLANIEKNLIHYLSHPEFAQRILLTRYRDLKRKAPWLFQ